MKKVWIKDLNILLTYLLIYLTIKKELKELMNFLNANSYCLNINLICISEDPFEMFNDFQLNFEIILAAGGVVQNSKKDVLMIYRNCIWDLPKGKIEINEPPKLAAIRELKEETNVSVETVNSNHFSTYHIYLSMSKVILKKTKWFFIKTNLEHQLIPQLEEGITAVSWISSSKIKNIKTYNSIKDVLNFFINY